MEILGAKDQNEFGEGWFDGRAEKDEGDDDEEEEKEKEKESMKRRIKEKEKAPYEYSHFTLIDELDASDLPSRRHLSFLLFSSLPCTFLRSTPLFIYCMYHRSYSIAKVKIIQLS